MAVTATVVTVGTTETSLVNPTGTTNPAKATITNRGGTNVFLGPTGVTTATGFQLAVGQTEQFELGRGDQIFGIVAAATEPVHVLAVT